VSDELPLSPDAPSILRLSETFGSIQGEGASAGEPCFFVRLASCNLACRWCDTRYTWDWDQFDYHREVTKIDVGELADRVAGSGYARLVITGGEPLLQQRGIARLLASLPADLVVEIETNGTLRPDRPLLDRVDQWNVSPKLSSSGEPAARRVHLDVLRTFRDTGRAFLKLVVAQEDDPSEMDALVRELGWPTSRILLMPEGARPLDLAAATPRVRSLALARGFSISPRLHVERFGGERGR
jgi:7-carboxy-7-deazaguanine synthase